MMYGLESFGGFTPGMGIWIGLLALWTLFWKGLALWHSARRNQGWWFLAMLVINTLGILEIIYLFGVTKLKADQLLPNKK